MSENMQNLQDASVDAGVPKALNYIEKLVAELCPEGVDIFTIDELISLEFGVRITKSNQKGTKYPVYGGGGESFRTDDYNRKDNYVISRFAMSEKCVRFVEGKFWMLDSGFTYSVKHDFLNYHYMGYWLLAHQSDIYNCSSQSAQKNLKTNNFKKFEVPVPPLKVQNAIVEILDKFTKLEAELEAELAARRAQYEYYRNSLFENLNGGGSEILGNLVKIKNGKSYKGFDSGDIPVYGSGGIMTYVDRSAYSGPSVLIPRKGSIGNIFYVDTPFWNVDTIFYTEINREQVTPKYLYHALQVQNLSELNTAGGVPSLTQTVLKRVRIPLPSLAEQERIVKILDKFDVLVNDISSGLPAEIEARRKQYEYYRDRLLTFPRKFEPAEQAMQR